MIRLLRIARREYLAYVRTRGFWLSLLLLPVGLSTIASAGGGVVRLISAGPIASSETPKGRSRIESQKPGVRT